MLKIIPALLIAAAMYAQTPSGTPPKPPVAAPAETSEKAPPDVDAALRARASKFYQLEVEAKFHEAEQLVAEDTKDFFVGSSKPSYYGFKIQDIRYSDNFTKAVVMLLVSRNVPVQGFIGHPVESRIPSRWKLENGQWCWFVDQQKDLPGTPFGMMGPPGMPPPGGGAGGGGVPGTPHALPPMPTMPANINKVRADKPDVHLKSTGQSAEQVGIVNPTPWTVGVSVVDPKIPGLSIKLDRPSVRPGEKAILNIQSTGDKKTPAQPVIIMVRVQQTNQSIPIKISFAN